MGFGTHAMIDISDCDTSCLSDLNLIFSVLYDLPQLIGMTRITQPYVFPYSGLIPEDKGVTGFVVLAESHCSIHTFQEKDYAFIDIFSCKPFDVDFTVDFLKQKFNAKKITINTKERGLDFPRS